MRLSELQEKVNRAAAEADGDPMVRAMPESGMTDEYDFGTYNARFFELDQEVAQKVDRVPGEKFAIYFTDKPV